MKLHRFSGIHTNLNIRKIDQRLKLFVLFLPAFLEVNPVPVQFVHYASGSLGPEVQNTQRRSTHHCLVRRHPIINKWSRGRAAENTADMKSRWTIFARLIHH